MSVQLPTEYLKYLEDGADTASTDGEPGYFQLWAPTDIEEFNRDYHVAEYAPGFLGFGSDGGGEMLAFDSAGAVFMIPFAGMSVRDAKRIASSWREVAARVVE